MDEIVSFGEWVQARRNQLKLSRTEMARRIGCAPVTIKKIERDERRPSPQMAELLAQHLQLPESEIEDFMRRARGEYVARFGMPTEMSLAEAQAPVAEEDAPKHNLTPQTTAFVGREAELAEINANLARHDCRLLTILAAGGMGKTRLGIAVAETQLDNFTDGVTYVSLAPVKATEAKNSINPLVAALADALTISLHANDTPEQQLITYLQRKEMLLLLDNFEHLLDTATFISELLALAADIKILITSRESLNLQEEWVYLLQGLPFPVRDTSDKEMDAFPAVQLFAQRAKQANSNFELVTELAAVHRICRLVEGMPLGLELAAAWVRQMPCSEIADEITHEMDFLTTRMRNVPERHRSIRAVFAYSWQQLSDQEQTVLQTLSVFRAGFEREAARSVAGASLPLLSALVDKSLLSVGNNGRFDPSGPPRYQLHELLRQFAAEKLTQSQQKDEARNRHCNFYLTFVADQRAKLQGSEEFEAQQAIYQDIDNVRAAIRWGADHQLELFNESLGWVLWEVYDIRGWILESKSNFTLISERLQSLCDQDQLDEESTIVSQSCLLWIQYRSYLGTSLWRIGRFQEADELLQSLLRYLPIEDETTHWIRSWCLTRLGIVAIHKNDFQRAMAYLEEAVALAVSIKDSWLHMICLITLAVYARNVGDYDKSLLMGNKAAELAEELGQLNWSIALAGALGLFSALKGDFSTAEMHTQTQAQLSLLRARGWYVPVAFTLRDLGYVAYLQGNSEAARDYYQQSLVVADEINLTNVYNGTLWLLGNLAVDQGDFENGIKYYQASGQTHPTVYWVGGPGWAALGLGKIDEATTCFRNTLQIALQGGTKPVTLDVFVGFAHISAREGKMNRALELLTLAQNHVSSNYEIKKKAHKLWEELTAELPPELVAKAEARGQALDLWETAESLLTEGDLS